MIIDKRTEFADSVSVGTPNNVTANLGNQIDLSVIGRDAGAGKAVYLVIVVESALTSGGASVVSFMLSSDSTASIAVDGSQTTHWESDRLAVAGYPAGTKIVVPLPANYPTYEQFLGVQIRESGSVALTGGVISAFLTYDDASWKTYADAAN